LPTAQSEWESGPLH